MGLYKMFEVPVSYRGPHGEHRCYDNRFIILPICTVAAAVKAMCKCCGKVRIFIPNTCCNGFDQRVARQQLCKHGLTRNNTGVVSCAWSVPTGYERIREWQRGRPTSTNPQLSDSNKNLVLGPQMGPATKTDWPTDRRS
jgi:hypothetical protein